MVIISNSKSVHNLPEWSVGRYVSLVVWSVIRLPTSVTRFGGISPLSNIFKKFYAIVWGLILYLCQILNKWLSRLVTLLPIDLITWGVHILLFFHRKLPRTVLSKLFLSPRKRCDLTSGHCFRWIRVRLPLLGRHQWRGKGLHQGPHVRRRWEEVDLRRGFAARVVSWTFRYITLAANFWALFH